MILDFRVSNLESKLIAWPYDIGFSSSGACIKAYDIGYDMGYKNPKSETRAERRE